MNLLDDPDIASDWKMTINAIASLTPLIKQLPWIIPMVRRVPGWFFTSNVAKTRAAPVCANSRCFQQKALRACIPNSFVVENEP